jgi:hypothetical protein
MKITPILFALGFAACAQDLPLSGAPCPCADGTYCDVDGRCHALQDGGPAAVTTPDNSTTTDAASPDPEDEIPTAGDAKACSVLGVATARDFETKFIAPRCGSANCHQAIFPPRNLDQPGLIRERLVGVRALSLCKDDFYIDRQDPGRSFFLNKCAGTTNVIRCASDGAQDSGGSRMPNAEGAPAGTAGPLLNQYEMACLQWWVFTVAKK